MSENSINRFRQIYVCISLFLIKVEYNFGITLTQLWMGPEKGLYSAAKFRLRGAVSLLILNVFPPLFAIGLVLAPRAFI